PSCVMSCYEASQRSAGAERRQTKGANPPSEQEGIRPVTVGGYGRPWERCLSPCSPASPLLIRRRLVLEDPFLRLGRTILIGAGLGVKRIRQFRRAACLLLQLLLQFHLLLVADEQVVDHFLDLVGLVGVPELA